MRIGNLSTRLTLFTDGGAVDVERASGGRFGSDPQSVYEVWDDFVGWAGTLGEVDAVDFDPTDLQAPTPAPSQVFAIGLNYREHASESKLDAPDKFPPVFTKFRTALSGPITTVALPPGGHVDWEVELVVVIGRRAEHVAASDAWSHVAGMMAGQDLSERITQLSGPAPQFSLGKSFPGFAPIGPWVVTADEFDDPDDIELQCAVGEETLQKGRTSEFLFGVPTLIEGLSRVTPLLPGDIIFGGTPPGVGFGRDPQRFLVPGDELISRVSGVGELCQTFVEGVAG